MMEPREFWTLIDFSKAFEPIATTSLKIKQRDYQTVGEYPIIDQGINLIGGYFDNADNLVSGTPPFVVFGDHTKVIKFVDFKFIPGADGIKILKPLPMFVPKLFYYFLKQLPLPDKGYARHFQHLSKNKIPLPPLPEQRAIVAKLETLLSDLDNAVSSLKQAKEQIKTYRQSVLKAAFTGKLTEEWRKRSSISHTWEVYKTKDLFQYVTSGSRGWAKYYADSGSLFVRIGNLDHGTINLDLRRKQYVNPPLGSEGIRTKVAPNDILISITADVGMIGLVPEGLEVAYINQHISIARPISSINPKYLAWFLSSSLGQAQFRELQKGATKVGLGLDDIKSVMVSVPCLEEQKLIVEKIYTAFPAADKLNQTIEVSLRRAEALKQSLLKQAFEGNLLTEQELEQTRQDPDWEPAEKLLERIKQRGEL